MKTTFALLSITATAFLTACSDSGTTASTATTSEALTKAFSVIQESPVTILKARETAKPGNSITLEGIVMGSKKPFVDGGRSLSLATPQS